MAKAPVSNKHLLINKANTMVVVVVALAAFFTTLSLVVSRSILAKRSYQSRVIAEKEKTSKQLKANIEAVDSLVSSYQAFVAQQENIIGGSSGGNNERDGDNAKIILDALPSKYDFPALATSLEKILLSRNLAVNSITGTDDEIAQTINNEAAASPVEIPFQIGISGSYTSAQDLVTILERSIRPIQINKLTFAGNDQLMQLSVDAKTFYQPEKRLNITTRVVK